jgi:uncharacterized membrane protein YeaQ/YmgE (transglycosylase-associated protein family)
VGLAVFVILIVVGGLVLGALARLAVPGPDPMPLWLTAAFGIAGALIGGLVSWAFLGARGGLPLAFVGSFTLIVLYRRVVQRRPLTGPAAKRRPEGGWGIGPPELEAARRLRELEDLRRSGAITPEEFDRAARDLGQSDGSR